MTIEAIACRPAPVTYPLSGIRHGAVPVRVAVRAQDPITAAGLRGWLRAHRSEVALVSDADEADVVVVAVEYRPVDGIRRAVEDCRARCGAAAVLVLVDSLPGAPVADACDVGADLVLTRDNLEHEALIRASLFAAGRRAALPAERPDRTPDTGRDVISDRERAVLRLLAGGADLCEVATELSYSERTVKNILYTLLGRLQLKNRVHAVSYAIRNELI